MGEGSVDRTQLAPTGSLPRSGRPVEAAFVALVVAGSLAAYVGRLGFYADDWDVLSVFTLSVDQSLRGLYAALAGQGQMLMRPGQKLLAALLYWAFGLRPLGYHLVNAGLLVASAVLLLLVLRELELPRAVAVAAATVYSLLPHYSTDRVWYASIQAPFSMATYLLSLYTGLRSLRSSPGGARGWQLLSLASLVASTLAYEVALPLFLLNPLLFHYRGRQLRGHTGGAPLAPRIFMGATAGAALAVAAFKATTSTRLSGGPSLVYLIATAKQLAWINLWIYGAAAPRTLLIAIRQASAPTLIAAGALVLAIYWFVLRVTDGWVADGSRSQRWVRLMLVGVGVFLLGHVVFLTTNVGFSPTGPNNRTAIVGAAGIALVGVGVAGWLADRLPIRWRARGFAGLIAAASGGAFIVNAMLVTSWVTAYEREQEVLGVIRRTFTRLPPGSTLILDGVCPYVGPAIVFESSWDLQGALRIWYRDSTLRADVVTPNLRVEGDGLHAVIYGGDSRYPYERLTLFDARRGTTTPLPDEAAARRYFSQVNPDRTNGCPPGRAGHGVRVF
jgi:hypothetical protein